MDDSADQVRGASIKVMGVHGDKLLKTPYGEKFTQDFLLISSDIFFTGDVEGMDSLLRVSYRKF